MKSKLSPKLTASDYLKARSSSYLSKEFVGKAAKLALYGVIKLDDWKPRVMKPSSWMVNYRLKEIGCKSILRMRSIPGKRVYLFVRTK